MIRANEAGWDRTLRVLIGGALLILGLSDALGAWMVTGAAVVGAVLVAAGLLGWCPLYAALGVSTLRRSGAGAGDS